MKRDLQYELDINALIPTAEREAKRLADLTPMKSERRPGAVDRVTGKAVFYNHSFYAEFFHIEMRRLAIEHGLRRF